MASLMGHDALLTHAGLYWKAHSWVFRGSTPVFDDTGYTATSQEFVTGDPSGVGSIECWLGDGSSSAKKPPDPGTALTDATFQTVSGTTLVSDITITDYEYIVRKRGGGPQQALRLSFRTSDVSSGSLLNPT